MGGDTMLWRLILLGVAAYILYRLIWGKRRRDSSARPRPSAGGKGEEVLVQDPWCKTYLPKSQALLLRDGKEVLYFCSEECKERFLSASTSRDSENQ